MPKNRLNRQRLRTTAHAVALCVGLCSGFAACAQELSFSADADAPQQAAPAPAAAKPEAPQTLWVYIDLNGVAHYAHEQLDSRYARFSMGALDKDDAPLHVDINQPPPPALASASTTTLTQAMLAQSERRIQAQQRGYQQNAKHLQAAAKRHNVDAVLLRAIASAESGFNPHAVSHKGAVGLMQIMPGTAERFGLSGDAQRSLEQKLKDPAINAPLAARYVSYLHKLFPGRTDLVLAAYNAGEGAVQRYGNKIPPYKETQNYVKTVMATYTTLKPAPAPPATAATGTGWRGDSTSTIVPGAMDGAARVRVVMNGKNNP